MNAIMKSDIPITCGFFPQSQNFVIRGLEKPTGLETPFQSSLINFLERGYPTRPTHFLEALIQKQMISLHGKTLSNLMQCFSSLINLIGI